MRRLVKYYIIAGRTVEEKRSWLPAGPSIRKQRGARRAGASSLKKIKALSLRALGRNAYSSMLNVWSPEVAAKRFVELTEALRESEGAVSLWEDGPGSVAPVM